MIYEIRTYDLKARAVPEFGKRTAEKVPGRVKYSALGGFWYTEVGPLNQVVHIWPYEDMRQRSEIRARVVADGVWPPNNDDLILNMRSDIFYPTSFMTPLGERDIGPIYEMRIYTYAPGVIPEVTKSWEERVADREKLSPLAGCWYSDVGGLNKWVHLWAYKSFEERNRIRDEARATGKWPPPAVAPLHQENKLLTPYEFSPMQ